MLNHALELEHAARIQYLSHAERIDGIKSEPIIDRLKEIAGDELEHEELFREMIGGYLNGVPSMKMDETREAEETRDILDINLKGEKEAVDFYMGIMDELKKCKEDLKYEYFALEHSLRHIIKDELEHISELKQLLG